MSAMIVVVFLFMASSLPRLTSLRLWAAAALTATASLLLVGSRESAWANVTVPVGDALLAASMVLCWMGVRRVLRLPIDWRYVGAGLLLVLLLQCGVGLIWGDFQLGRHCIFFAAQLFCTVGGWRDVKPLKHAENPLAYRVVTRVLGVELTMGGLVFFGLWGAFFSGWSYSEVLNISAVMVFLFVASVFMRYIMAVIFYANLIQQESQAAYATLADKEAERLSLLNHINASVMVFSPERRLLSCNREARRFANLAESEDAPVPLARLTRHWSFFDANGAAFQPENSPLDRVMQTGNMVKDVVIGARPHAQADTRWALVTAYPHTNEAGKIAKVVLSFVDITSLKVAEQQKAQLEEQLAQSKKIQALGTLAGGVAHDFNNILAAILGNVTLASEDVQRGGNVGESLDEIRLAARRGREVVRQIQAFTQLQPLRRVPLQLEHVLEESMRMLKASAGAGVLLTARIAPETPAILGDDTQMGRVLLNLGNNACQAVDRPGGKVFVSVDALQTGDQAIPEPLAPCPGVVRIVVKDNGAGMDKVTQQRIFEPFFTTKAVGQGSGLGLPVVLGIVQAHGGVVEVRSAPGQGTAITLYFPAHCPVFAAVHAGLLAA